MDQVLLGALGTASWMPILGSKTRRAAPEWGRTLALEARGEAGEERGEKNVHTEGQRHLGFPQKMYATGQEAQMRKAQAKLGTGDSSTDCAAPGGDGNGSKGDARCLHCSASSPAPSLCAEGHHASPLQGIQPKTRQPSFETMRTCPRCRL